MSQQQHQHNEDTARRHADEDARRLTCPHCQCSQRACICPKSKEKS